MKVYLLRHGAYENDENRRLDVLTAAGRHNIEQLGQYLHKQNVTAHSIYHSGIHRALQTADIVGKAIQSPEIVAYPGLSPNDDVDGIAYDIMALNKDIFIVSHLPFLSRLLNKLLAVNTENDIVYFDTGTCVALIQNNARFSIWWTLNPSLLS